MTSSELEVALLVRRAEEIRDYLRRISACLTLETLHRLRHDQQAMAELEKAWAGPLEQAVEGRRVSLFDVMKDAYWEAVQDVVGPTSAADAQPPPPGPPRAG
jgi:hypothetical protein